jgi:glutamyl-tRNA reductase
VILSTCNRVEIYAVASHQSLDANYANSLLQSLCARPCDLRPHSYFYEDLNAALHLFRVAAGLDSMVLGETEITGQVKKAYEVARGVGLTGGTLNRVFQTAFRVLKEIRSKTGIGRGATSVGGVTAELAGRIFSQNLSTQSVMIIGAGQMGETCVRHLKKRGVRSILVSNRSFERAFVLAGDFGGRAVRFEQHLTAMVDVDIVVASTSWPKTLLQGTDIEGLMITRRNRPLILIDISVPRNIEPEVRRLDNVYLYNIDDLNAVVCENLRNRKQDLASCNRIIEARAGALISKLNSGKKRVHEVGIQIKPGWSAQCTAVGAG